jgi:hypothetical protein
MSAIEVYFPSEIWDNIKEFAGININKEIYYINRNILYKDREFIFFATIMNITKTTITIRLVEDEEMDYEEIDQLTGMSSGNILIRNNIHIMKRNNNMIINESDNLCIGIKELNKIIYEGNMDLIPIVV